MDGIGLQNITMSSVELNSKNVLGYGMERGLKGYYLSERNITDAFNRQYLRH